MSAAAKSMPSCTSIAWAFARTGSTASSPTSGAPVTPIALHDLLAGPYVMPVDLVWSCEVAEHIAPDKVGHYVDTLTNGRIIAMTHAVPGQGGHHHVNCQPEQYWIRLITERGYVLAPQNATLREVAGKDLVWNHFARSGLVFLRA